MSKILLSLLTKNRERILKECLETVTTLHAPPGVEVEFLLVDNNDSLELDPIISDFVSRIPFPTCVLKGTDGGIVSGRNLALEQADKSAATHLAFFDDDELLRPHWLCSLWDTLQEHSCQACGGPVDSTFPESTPKWLQSASPFVREEYGRAFPCQRLPATNNVLLDLELVRRHNLRFQQAFSDIGGSDTDFFLRLRSHGAQFAWAQEARISEVVPAERARLNWIAKRCYRYGATEAMRRSRGFSALFGLLFRASLGLVGYLSTLPLCLILWSAAPHYARVLLVGTICGCCHCLGNFGGLVGLVPREYA